LDGWWLIRDFTALATTSVETPRRMQRAVAYRLLALAADVTLRSANAVMFWIVGQLLSRPQ
jgi:hypothetical protein